MIMMLTRYCSKLIPGNNRVFLTLWLPQKWRGEILNVDKILTINSSSRSLCCTNWMLLGSVNICRNNTALNGPQSLSREANSYKKCSSFLLIKKTSERTPHIIADDHRAGDDDAGEYIGRR